MSILSVKRNGVEVLTSTRLSSEFVHGFSTRFGGVSRGVFASLNLGVHRGDDPENVLENYRRFGEAVGFRPEQTVLTHQVHETRILTVGAADRGTGLFREQEIPCDGLMTDTPGVALTVFSADCGTILLADPVRRAVCAVHAGWRGTAAGIARLAVEQMERELGCDPRRITAALGPCIGACCFHTHEDVPRAMEASLGAGVRRFLRRTEPDGYLVDLKGINRWLLEESGVETVEVCPGCTACQPEKYWSHRKTGNARGSLAAVIMIKE